MTYNLKLTVGHGYCSTCSFSNRRRFRNSSESTSRICVCVRSTRCFVPAGTEYWPMQPRYVLMWMYWTRHHRSHPTTASALHHRLLHRLALPPGPEHMELLLVEADHYHHHHHHHHHHHYQSKSGFLKFASTAVVLLQDQTLSVLFRTQTLPGLSQTHQTLPVLFWAQNLPALLLWESSQTLSAAD